MNMEVIMKKLKLFLAIVMCLFAMPLAVLADEGDAEVTSGEAEVKEEDTRVKIYFFRGEGCPHCAEAEEFFKSIKEEYGQYYKILDYETWNDANNADLLQKVGETRGENITGVPYILIGDKSWAGYDTSYDEGIKAAIKAEYEKDVADRYDIAKLVDFGDGLVEEPDHSNDAMILIIILLVAAGITYGVVVARKKTV